MNNVTQNFNFYHGNDPRELVQTFGSPLYVYNERILRERCRDIINLSTYPKFAVNYAVKTNSNLSLLKIIREEGLRTDISSEGEAVAALAAGFLPEEMLFILNGVGAEELAFASKIGSAESQYDTLSATVSVDSLSQLETLGRVNPGGRIFLRFNSGIGGGHHEKVVTGGDGTKFGIMPEYIPQVKELLRKYDLKLIGINQHVGSYIEGELYLEGVEAILRLARQFENLEYIDFGGGFMVPYHKQNGEGPIDLRAIGKRLDAMFFDFAKNYGKELTFMVEPGRYIVAECAVLLGTVHSLKNCGTKKYAGTDLGFSVFKRPTVYDAHHDIDIYRDPARGEGRGHLHADELSASDSKQDIFCGPMEKINIVGNQCETGDFIARDRELPPLREGDVLGILDAGAYGYSMACQYNHRARPAEVLISQDGEVRLIRRRDTYEDMLANMQGL
ncbi:MAG: diaminopimelate decarboxylase [Defluviitaleaceae bacterium]|nr:diaminopimelate decarboxylase [Defluviitaleaceae bacterium]